MTDASQYSAHSSSNFLPLAIGSTKSCAFLMLPFLLFLVKPSSTVLPQSIVVEQTRLVLTCLYDVMPFFTLNVNVFETRFHVNQSIIAVDRGATAESNTSWIGLLTTERHHGYSMLTIDSTTSFSTSDYWCTVLFPNVTGFTSPVLSITVLPVSCKFPDRAARGRNRCCQPNFTTSAIY